MFIVLYILGALCNALPGIINLGSYTLNDVEHGWYYILQAVSYLFIVYGTKYYDSKIYLHRGLFKVVWCLALGNVIDELFFDPRKIGLNEVVLAFILITAYIHKIWNQAHKRMN